MSDAKAARRRVRIAAWGFSDDQSGKLARILRLSRTHPYSLVELDTRALPDLLLVFGKDALNAETIKGLPTAFRSRLILVSKSRRTETDLPQISYPLISSRVLKALDQLISASEEMDAAEAEQTSENRFAKYTQPVQTSSASSPANRYRVLVVDDSQPMQHALVKELSEQFSDIRIDLADNGEQALERVATTAYDFIFLDVMMPGIDGFETCTRMRQRAEMKKTPIIMLTSKTSPLDEVKGIMAGSSTYLTKPIKSDEFRKVITRITRWIDDFAQSHPATRSTT